MNRRFGMWNRVDEMGIVTLKAKSWPALPSAK
jgi:hypothetical protein